MGSGLDERINIAPMLLFEERSLLARMYMLRGWDLPSGPLWSFADVASLYVRVCHFEPDQEDLQRKLQSALEAFMQDEFA